MVQPTTITLLKVDYAKMAITQVSKIQHAGVVYQTLVPISTNCFVIVCQRDVTDAKDVIQSVLIRVTVEEYQPAYKTRAEDVLHFDVIIH